MEQKENKGNYSKVFFLFFLLFPGLSRDIEHHRTSMNAISLLRLVLGVAACLVVMPPPPHVHTHTHMGSSQKCKFLNKEVLKTILPKENKYVDLVGS